MVTQPTTRDDVYRKFGETSEAGQLLETELGNLHLFDRLMNPDSSQRPDLIERINRQTLGQLIRGAPTSIEGLDKLESLLESALKERNRLQHSFYRQHNLRLNSDEGRAMMIEDLEEIHKILSGAFKALFLLSGVDLDEESKKTHYLPYGHLPI